MPACRSPVRKERGCAAPRLQQHEGLAAVLAARAQCMHGHSFDETNTRIRKNGTRLCRACDRNRRNEANRRRREDRAPAVLG